MVTPQIGAVVVVPFPFSDLSSIKLRPALVLAASGRNDWICLQITSNPYSDPRAIELDQSDFSTGSLRRVSFARPGKLFTAHASLFQRTAGVLREETLVSIREVVIDILRRARDENSGA